MIASDFERRIDQTPMLIHLQQQYHDSVLKSEAVVDDGNSSKRTGPDKGVLIYMVTSFENHDVIPLNIHSRLAQE